MKDNCISIEDFLNNESFVTCVNRENDKDEEEWNVWLDENHSEVEIGDNLKANTNKGLPGKQ